MAFMKVTQILPKPDIGPGRNLQRKYKRAILEARYPLLGSYLNRFYATQAT
jgi:hypothetical protein